MIFSDGAATRSDGGDAPGDKQPSARRRWRFDRTLCSLSEFLFEDHLFQCHPGKDGGCQTDEDRISGEISETHVFSRVNDTCVHTRVEEEEEYNPNMRPDSPPKDKTMTSSWTCSCQSGCPGTDAETLDAAPHDEEGCVENS